MVSNPGAIRLPQRGCFCEAGFVPVNFRSARAPTRIDARRGDLFPVADLSVVTLLAHQALAAFSNRGGPALRYPSQAQGTISTWPFQRLSRVRFPYSPLYPHAESIARERFDLKALSISSVAIALYGSRTVLVTRHSSQIRGVPDTSAIPELMHMLISADILHVHCVAN